MGTERGWHVLEARPAEAEAGFAHAGLSDLLAGVETAPFDRLPSPQRRALDVALAREDPAGPDTDPGAIAFAFLNLLRELARTAPVSIAIDDAHWLDPPSATIVGFAARRLRHEPIGMLLTARSGTTMIAGLDPSSAGPHEAVTRISVPPLRSAAVGELIETRLGISLPYAILERVRVTSGGNPLSLVPSFCLTGHLRPDECAARP